MVTASNVWPFTDLVIRSPRLTLRTPNDELLWELADVAVAGVTADSTFQPFDQPWHVGTPEQIKRGVLQYHWRKLGELRPESWHLAFVVSHDDTVIGVQSVDAEDFRVARAVETGSWLGREFHGRGFGTEMRAAMLEFVFRGLGAREAHTKAFDDNAASLAVTRKLGYRSNGTHTYAVETSGAGDTPVVDPAPASVPPPTTAAPAGVSLSAATPVGVSPSAAVPTAKVARTSLGFIMRSDEWTSPYPIELAGVEPCLPLLGAD